MLRKIRIAVALVLFAGITFSLLDFAGLLPASVESFLPKIQFLPALLSLNIIVLVVLLAGTWLLGRVYCSVICPMGVFQDIFNFFGRKIIRRKKYGYRKNLGWLRWGIVALLLVCGLFGLNLLVGLVEPYSMYGRIVVNLFQPLYEYGNNFIANELMKHDIYTFYTVDVLFRSTLVLVVSIVTFLLLAVISFFWGRTWCNNICPVGTLLGYLSKFSLLKIHIDTDACNGCKVCGRKCKAYCIDTAAHKVDYSRCVDCFDCIDNCKQHAISFGLGRKKAASSAAVDGQPDESLRTFIKAGTATALLLPVALSGRAQELLPPALKPVKRAVPITPPGSGSIDHLLAHCTSCHLCVGKCPSHVIKPAVTEYGLGGFMQPTLDYSQNCCDVECTVCGDVCPTGAIRPLTTELRRTTRVGHAIYHPNNCLITRENVGCGLCATNCPLGAITMVPRGDEESGLNPIPSVDASVCVGCGACEYYCPATPLKGMTVEGYARHNPKV